MRFDETLLEFDAVRKILSEYCVCGLGQRAVMSMTPCTDRGRLESMMTPVSEMLELLRTNDPPPIYELRDCTEIIKRARYEGCVLEPLELLDIRHFLETAGRMRSFFEYEHAEIAPSLRGLALPLYNLPALAHSIADKITPEGTVCDNASELLAQLRKDITRLSEGIKRDLLNMVRRFSGSGELQDTFWTMRNNRYVLPVKSTHRSRVQGIIHDSSNSGETVFIEPLGILEQTNQLADVQVREREEVYRILRVISSDVTSETAVLQSNEQVLSEFDLIFAKARFAFSHQCNYPNLTDHNRPVCLVKAHHPLLYISVPQSSIPLTVRMQPQDRSLIVTGPNAGGKTTALKTVGLSVMMTQCAVPIPASPESHLPVFENVLVAIGDEQNVLEGESTFSSHMRRLRDILKGSEEHSLVLLDELGTATDPNEGGALAVAILEALCERKALSIISTHLSVLKNWAEQYEGACNASFRLDPQSHRPTFQLHIGLPGISEAIVVAEAVGLPPEVIARARALRPKGEEDASVLISGLQQREQAMNEMAEEARRALAKAKRYEEAAEKQLNEMREERRLLQGKFLAEKKQAMQELRHRVETLLASQPTKTQLDEERRSLRQEEESAEVEHSEISAAPVSELFSPEELHEGDVVFVPSIDDVARIIRLRADRNEVKVQSGLISLTLKISDLRRVPAQDADNVEAVAQAMPQALSVMTHSERKKIKKHLEDAPMSLSVIGMRLPQAEEAVDVFLGRALSGGLKEARVVHGHGTGALRRGLQEYFRTHPMVKSYRSAPIADGGNAVTIVELKS